MIQILTVLSIVFGITQTVFVGSALAGRTPGFLVTDRAMFITAFVLGLILCSFGIQLSQRLGSFSRFGIISGLALGLPLLVLLVGVLTGRLPSFLLDPNIPLAVLGGFMMTKWIIMPVQAIPAALRAQGGMS
jgi:hypothetical protein